MAHRRGRAALVLALLMMACGGETERVGPTTPPPAPPVMPPPPPPPPPGPAGEWSPSNTYTDYTMPEGAYSALTWTMRPVQSPAESLHRKGLLHYYAFQFDVGSTFGYAGLQSDGHYYGERQGKVVNFSIWNAPAYDSAHVDALAETENHESRGARIMLPYEWEEGEEYRFTLSAAPHEGGYAWRLDVNGTLVGRILGDSTMYPARPYMLTWGEDLHWWHTYDGRRAYRCEDMEPSSMQFLDVRAHDEAGGEHAAARSTSWISRDTQETVTGDNGHVTTLCGSPMVKEVDGGVQHDLGHHP